MPKRNATINLCCWLLSRIQYLGIDYSVPCHIFQPECRTIVPTASGPVIQLGTCISVPLICVRVGVTSVRVHSDSTDKTLKQGTACCFFISDLVAVFAIAFTTILARFCRHGYFATNGLLFQNVVFLIFLIEHCSKQF